MKVVVLATIVFVALFLFLLLCKGRRIDHFFNNDSVTVSWTAPSVPDPSNLAYQWTVCNTTGTACTPTIGSGSWSAPVTTTSTSVVLTSTNCVGCEFGGNFTFAVRSIDTSSQLNSGWSNSQIPLQQTVGGSAVVTDSSGVGLAVGSGTFRYVAEVGYASTPPVPSDLVSQMQITLTRGSTVYSIDGDLTPANTAGPGNMYSYIGQGSFSSQTWTPSAPGDLQMNDTLAFTALVANNGTSVATSTSPVYFFGTKSISITAVAPGAPSVLSFAVSG